MKYHKCTNCNTEMSEGSPILCPTCQEGDTPPQPQKQLSECPQSKRVDGKFHSWVFDGDDPYVICHYCGEIRDALTGQKIPPYAPESPKPSQPEKCFPCTYPEHIHGSDEKCCVHNHPIVTSKIENSENGDNEPKSIVTSNSQLTEEDRELLKNWKRTRNVLTHSDIEMPKDCGDCIVNERFIEKLLAAKDREAEERIFKEWVKNEKKWCDIVKEAVKKERERCISIVEKQGTVIHQGELSHGIYGLLIDIEKVKNKILNPEPLKDY